MLSIWHKNIQYQPSKQSVSVCLCPRRLPAAVASMEILKSCLNSWCFHFHYSSLLFLSSLSALFTFSPSTTDLQYHHIASMKASSGRISSHMLRSELPRCLLWRNGNKAHLTTSCPTPTFHRRKLPDSLIALSSREGRNLFKEALETHTMESYFPLSEQFITQSEPSYCSLSSLAMVLNALNHDPKRTWKGVWRWVTEETLQCENNNLLCKHTVEKLRTEGEALD